MIDRFRFSQGWQPLPTDDHNRMVAAFYEILEGAKVPPEMYDACYQAYMQHRSELKAQGKDPGVMAADDLVAEWWKVRRLNQEIDKTRLLPEYNLASCQRCFGTGKEEMPDGSVRENCEHLPFAEGEIEERAKAKAKAIEFLRESAAKIGSPKPVETVKPKYQKLACSACGRKSSTYFGWTVGETCGQLISEGVTC